MSFEKCMLASDADLSILRYPLYASPKIDGIRCRIWDNKPMSRSWKVIRNRHVQKILSHPYYNGLDGELAVGNAWDKNLMQQTTSGVMSADGEPSFRLWCFDTFCKQAPFSVRYAQLHDWFTRADHRLPMSLKILEHKLIRDSIELVDYEAEQIAAGYEGIITRDPEGFYKNGRSTAREQGMLKVKRFKDSEAEIVGSEEFMHNANEATVNALGHTERSSHKANKIGMNMLGAFLCRDLHTGQSVRIGTGFTHGQRKIMWDTHHSLIGRIVKYKYFDHGIKDAPRHPVFLDFRDKEDM